MGMTRSRQSQCSAFCHIAGNEIAVIWYMFGKQTAQAFDVVSPVPVQLARHTEPTGAEGQGQRVRSCQGQRVIGAEGHPLKGPRQEKRVPHSRKVLFSCEDNIPNLHVICLRLPRAGCTRYFKHQVSVSINCTSHPSGSRARECDIYQSIAQRRDHN